MLSYKSTLKRNLQSFAHCAPVTLFNKLTLALLIRLLLCSAVFANGNACAQDSLGPKPTPEFFETMQEKLLNHSDNLNTASAASPLSEIDQLTLNLMSWSVYSTTSLLAYVSGLNSLHITMENENDRGAVRRALVLAVVRATSQLDTAIRRIDTQISYARSPAIVSEGKQLRNDLRTFRDRLEALKY
jgi:hypothetical protein